MCGATHRIGCIKLVSKRLEAAVHCPSDELFVQLTHIIGHKCYDKSLMAHIHKYINTYLSNLSAYNTVPRPYFILNRQLG